MSRITLDWIGKHLSDGKDFKPLARRAMASLVGNVFYVDLAAGADSGTGENWDRAYLTSAYALDQCESDNNDYLLLTGWKTETAAAVIHRLDVAYTHFIGHSGLMNPMFPEKGTIYRSTAFDGPIIRVEQEFVEVAGFAVAAKQGAGTESSSVSKGQIEIGDYLDANAAGDGNKAYLHNIQFTDWNDATQTTGLTITGAHYPVGHTLNFDNVYGNMDSGIYFCGSDDANPGLGDFRDLVFRGGFTQGIKCYAGGSFQNMTFDGITQNRGTYVVDFTSDYATSYSTFDHIQAGAIAASAIFNSASTVDARDTLLSVMGSTAGSNVYAQTVFPDT